MDKRLVQRKLDLLSGLAPEASLPLAAWEARTADHLAPGEYVCDGDWAPVTLPAAFPAGKTVFLRAAVTVPEGFPPAESFLSFAFEEMEGLLSVNGEPYAGLDANHARTPLPEARELALEAEFLSVPGVLCMPEWAGKTGVFYSAAVVRVDRYIEALVHEVRFAWETAQVAPDALRRRQLEAAVEAALLAVDLTLPRERLREEVVQAREILRQHLAAIPPDPASGGVYAVGHTHIDTAWLWPLRETVRKCARTFSTACRLMERYPAFHFTCSQPQLYQYVKDHYPSLYAEIRRWVAEGRWETAGAMWVEADCNVTSGESLIRQILYGLGFFQAEFGTRPRMCWLPDVFGYPSALPEILAGCGLAYFYTYKLFWQPANRFPHSLFRWRGLDGSEVLAQVVDHVGGYNSALTPEALVRGWEMYAQKTAYPEVLFPFGYGDGGGGVTEEFMERYSLAAGRYPGLPALRTGTAEAFFDAAASALPDLSVWDGELYVETHRGTYTTQSALKRANRRCELALREAEIWGSLAIFPEATRAFSAETLRPAWQTLLTRQFHDILPGSSIGMVYEEALPALAEVLAQAQAEAAASLTALATPDEAPSSVTLANSLSWPREDVFLAEVPAAPEPVSLVSSDGTAHAAQVVERHDGRATLACSAPLPAVGWAIFTVSSQPVAAPELSVSTDVMENQFFRLELTATGALSRLYDKRYAREVLLPGALGNDLQLLQDGPEREDAWNVHETGDKRHYPWEGDTRLEVRESGPVRAVVRVTRTHRETLLEQDVILYAGLPRIDFVTRADWQARQTLLKVAFPLNLRTTRATYEVQFGAYERPTHRNTPWDAQKFEVPGQRWADLSEAGYGVSLLNDGRYGWDALGSTLRLTLLRGTTWPDPQADRGAHEFTYALLPHAGGWVEADTVRRAWELNVPAQALPGAGAAASRTFLELSGADAILEALKPAEDGRGLILRVYEPHGARGTVSLRLGFPAQRVVACNLVEEDADALPLESNAFHFDLSPFQIRAFRIT